MSGASGRRSSTLSEAFRGYVAALHQLYLMGMAMELKRLGYHMTKWG